MGARIFNCGDLAFRTALAKASRNQDCVHFLKRIRTLFFNLLAINIVDMRLGFGVDTCVNQCLRQGFIRLGQVHVFAHKGNIHGVFRICQRVRDVLPSRQIRRLRQHAQLMAHNLVQHLVVQQFRNPINRIRVNRADDRLERHIGEQRDFLALIFGNQPVGAAQQNIRLDTDLAQLFHRVLRRLGFQFTRRGNPRQ